MSNRHLTCLNKLFHSVNENYTFYCNNLEDKSYRVGGKKKINGQNSVNGQFLNGGLKKII